MIIKCSECQEPMSESIKNRPPNLPADIKWVTCKQCDRGIELMGEAPKDEVGIVNAINYTQTVTITQYITIKQIGGKVVKQVYHDPERTKLIEEIDMSTI